MRVRDIDTDQIPPPAQRWRKGAVLVIAALLLPVLVGATGLVIDAGLLMVLSRQTQNAADAAATAAALDLLLDQSVSTAQATAVAYVRTHNRLSAANVTVNIPPSRGPYQGNASYVEVIVQSPAQTVFVQVLGINREQTVRRLAVAGMRRMTPTPGVVALDPRKIPGLSVGGGGALRVNGNITVNSEGGGVDEIGNSVNNGNTGTAVSVANNSTLRATDVRVVGGVNNPANFLNYDLNNPNSPLKARILSVPDPFLHLPPPTVNNGAIATNYGNAHQTGIATLSPGVYSSISIPSGTVTFEPGIYIIRGGDLRINASGVTAEGVMFYMTGSDYNVSTGLPDSGDLDKSPPAAGNARFGSVTINGDARFSGLNDPSSPFYGMLFYQRRLNTNDFSIQGNSAAGKLVGTIYQKWAPMKISGQGTYAARFIVGEMSLSGTADVTIDVRDIANAGSDQVVLVE